MIFIVCLYYTPLFVKNTFTFAYRLEYKLSREYNWNVKNKASKGYEETFFFVYRDDGVYYNELETRLVKVRWRSI